ncbi:MAG TPA: glycosyltransferase family 4 protein [Solirubrobacteraceae bacterium]|nr:glycosyltransferase family 4 protein [Solirubrobacteraceae bacterium]
MPDRPLRLLHLADYAAVYPGSFIPMVTALGRAARDRGWEVSLVFPAAARGRAWMETLEAEGLGPRTIELGAGAGPARWLPAFAGEATFSRAAGRVAREVASLLPERGGPAILHTQFTMFDMPAVHAARRQTGARVVWHEQSARPTGIVGEAGSRLRYRLFGRDVAAILCVAPDIAETVARQGGGARTSVVRNAVDTDRFAPAALARREAAREALGIDGAATVLLAFGTHWERKGGDLFLEAFRILAASRGGALRGLIVGGSAARSAVGAARLSGAVNVLEPTAEVEDLYAAADVFLSPSRAEGMPFAVLEALAVGRSVVASDIPGQAAIASAVAACRLAALEPGSIAAAVEELLSLDEARHREELASAREWIVANAGLGWWSRTVMDTYDRVLAAP